MIRQACLCGWMLAFVCLISAKPAQAQFDGLLKRIPPSANALVLIDVDAVHKSPKAIRERWQETYETEYMKRGLILPPEASRIALAAQLNQKDDMSANWELAVMDLNDAISMRSVARSEGGYVDEINGAASAWTPSNAYFVELDPKLMGVMYPDNRQAVARWTQFGQTNDEVLLSSYLQLAAERVNREGQIVMALDMSEAMQPHALEETLATLELFEGKMDVDLRGIADALMGLQGLTLAVNIGDEPKGKVWIEFDRDIKALKPFAKQLALTALEKHGATIEDLKKWKFDIGYNTITMEGPMTESAMRRVFSVLEIPSTKFSTVDEEEVTASDGNPTVGASQTYFSSLTVLIDDLRKGIVGKTTSTSLWMDRYARKIDRMPILNVDEELLAFGASVSASFRVMSGAKKTSAVRKGVRQSNTYGNYYRTGYGGRYGGRHTRYGYGVSASSQRARISTQERAKANTVKFDEFEKIENSLAAIRQRMTQKYMVEFQ